MKSLFTIHAGEYLVGSYIEDKYNNLRVWVPSKDKGIDLLVTENECRKSVSLQIKFSKDFRDTDIQLMFRQNLKACGWWTLDRSGIDNSPADLWVFVLYSFRQRTRDHIVVEPKELLNRLTRIHGIHGDTKTIHCYFWVTAKNRCWETRGLSKRDQDLILNDSYSDPVRDFSSFLNNWKELENRLK